MVLCLCVGLTENCLQYVSPDLLRQCFFPFTCSALFDCITSCCYFLFISINGDFHSGHTFPSFSTIFAGRINHHLLKLSKFNVSHLAQPECSCMRETRANSNSSHIQKTILLYHINLILKRNENLTFLFTILFFSDPFRFLICRNGMISWLWNKTIGSVDDIYYEIDLHGSCFGSISVSVSVQTPTSLQDLEDPKCCLCTHNNLFITSLYATVLPHKYTNKTNYRNQS